MLAVIVFLYQENLVLDSEIPKSLPVNSFLYFKLHFEQKKSKYILCFNWIKLLKRSQLILAARYNKAQKMNAVSTSRWWISFVVIGISEIPIYFKGCVESTGCLCQGEEILDLIPNQTTGEAQKVPLESAPNKGRKSLLKTTNLYSVYAAEYQVSWANQWVCYQKYAFLFHFCWGTACRRPNKGSLCTVMNAE